MATYRIDLAYDGTGFHGFARQPSVRTVQGVLEAALSQLTGTEVITTGAGRTDAGVHARGQVVSFELAEELAPGRLVRSLNGLLGPEVVVTGAAPAPEGFDARFSARWRSYRYLVLGGEHPDPLRRHTTWHVPDPLDLAAMNRVAADMVGEHDFASFCRRSGTTMRRVLEAGWLAEGDLHVFSIKATAFCHQMVRSLVGYSVDAGRGRVRPDSLPAVLAARDRAAARQPAPSHGLILWEVGY